MNKDGHDTNRLSDRHLEDIEQRALSGTSQNAEDVLAPTRANEHNIHLQCQPNNNFTLNMADNDKVIVVVDTDGLSSSEKTSRSEDNTGRKTILQKSIVRNGTFSSESQNNYLTLTEPKEEIQLDNTYNEDESIVTSYLQNQNYLMNLDHSDITTKKKQSLLDKVPKMETIPEGEQYNHREAHWIFLVHLPQTYEQTSVFLLHRSDVQDSQVRRAVQFLHEDKEFLVAAEIGNHRMLQILIRKGVDVQQKDHLGRNALHLAVCADSEQAIVVLLNAGVSTNVKDNVGMTPLSLCLMRRPSLKVASLLFDHGAKILPRTNVMDTGLYLQFVMMCTPTDEEVMILRLLLTKGALINDPEAPGGRQALHFAAMSDNCQLIHVLIDLGADLFLVNHRNETPKEVALTFKCKKAYAHLNQLEALNEMSITYDMLQ